MKLGILNADRLIPAYDEQFGQYPDMFARRFQSIDPAIELVSYDVQQLVYPEDIDEVDAYLITGSKSSVYDDEPWIHRLIEFVRALHARKKPIAGICFGHQLVAHALGGLTRKAEQGWCIGIHEAAMTPAAEQLGFDGAGFKLMVSHQDQVTELAEGSQVLASTPACPVAMAQVGDHILTFQGHPEFDKEFARQVYESRREIYGEALLQEALDSMEQKTDHNQVIRWIVDFLKSRI